MTTSLKLIFTYITLLLVSVTFAQTTQISGVLLDENNLPIENVTITYANGGVKTTSAGDYIITIPTNTDITLVYSHISFEKMGDPSVAAKQIDKEIGKDRTNVSTI